MYSDVQIMVVWIMESCSLVVCTQHFEETWCMYLYIWEDNIEMVPKEILLHCTNLFFCENVGLSGVLLWIR
jgi:hypothetical protein